MNREIKFRAFIDGEMKQVTPLSDGHVILGLAPIFMDVVIPMGRQVLCIISHEPIDVMQFTGLQDKNGVDIYEGDIVKHDLGHHEWVKRTWTVCFEFGSFQMRTEEYNLPIAFITHAYQALKNDAIGDQDEYCSHIEIIGNIYSNPINSIALTAPLA